MSTGESSWKHVVFMLLFGQLLSLFLSTMGILSQELVNTYHFDAPTIQNIPNYCLLAAFYTPYCLAKGNLKAIFTDWKKTVSLFLLALVDVEANWIVVKAYQYTNFLSIQLLDCFTIPAVFILAVVLLKQKFSLKQIGAAILCVGGMSCIIGADVITKRTGTNLGNINQSQHHHYLTLLGPNPALGDGLCLIGATLYAFSNSLEEKMLRNHFNSQQVLAAMGLFGTFISTIQGLVLELKELQQQPVWSYEPWLYLCGFGLTLFLYYSLVPVFMLKFSAVSYNLSLLTSDLYSLLVGLTLYHFKLHWLYFVGFGIIMSGLTAFMLASKPDPPESSNQGYIQIENEGDERDLLNSSTTSQ